MNSTRLPKGLIFSDAPLEWPLKVVPTRLDRHGRWWVEVSFGLESGKMGIVKNFRMPIRDSMKWPESWWIETVEGALSRHTQTTVSVDLSTTRFLHPSGLLALLASKEGAAEVDVPGGLSMSVAQVAERKQTLEQFLWFLFEARAIQWTDDEFQLVLRKGLPRRGRLTTPNRVLWGIKEENRLDELLLLECALCLGLTEKARQALYFTTNDTTEQIKALLEHWLDRFVQGGAPSRACQWVEWLLLSWTHGQEKQKIVTLDAL